MKENQVNNSCSFLCSWSGGKDSYFAFYQSKLSGFKPVVLLNTLNEFGQRSRSHGIPKELVQEQARSVGLPIEFIETTWSDYEVNYIEKLRVLKEKYSFNNAVFGDIDIESHRVWEEKVSEAAGLKALLPIWQKDRRELVESIIDAGMQCLIVSCRKELADAIIGKIITRDLIKEFERLGIDVCGENGEYHTLVVDGPLHLQPTLISVGEVQFHNDYAFLSLNLEAKR